MAQLVADPNDVGDGSHRPAVVKELGPVHAARPRDVPSRYRDDPAVVRWFADRDAGVHAAGEDVMAPLRADLKEVLIEGQRHVVEDLTYAFTAQFGTPAFLERILTPLLHEVGDDWMGLRCTTAHEHLASAGLIHALHAVRGPTPPRRLRPPGSLDVLVFNPEGEQHSLPVEILAVRLEDAGHRPTAVAGGVPLPDLVDLAQALDPGLALCSTTMRSAVSQAVAAAHALVDALPDLPVVLGGQAFGPVPPGLPRGARAIPDATTTDAVVVTDAIGGRGPGHVVYAR